MKAVIALAFVLLFAIVGCKQGSDGGLPPFGADAYSQVTTEKNKKFVNKFKESNKKLFNDKKLKKVLAGGSPFREGMPTNNLGGAYQNGDEAGLDFLKKVMLAKGKDNFCSLSADQKAARIIEVSVDIQNSLRLLEVAMRAEDYAHIMQHADALNHIPLDVAKQIMTDLMTNPQSSYYRPEVAEMIAKNASRDPQVALNELNKIFKNGANTTLESLSAETQADIKKWGQQQEAKGINIPKDRLVAAYYQHRVDLIQHGEINGQLTGLNVMVGGRLVLPEGAKAPLQTIAEKYRRLLVLRAEVNKKYTEENVAEARLSKQKLVAAEESYNNKKFNREVKQALEDLSKVFPNSKFLKNKNQVFLQKLELNKNQVGIGRSFNDGRLTIKERKDIVKKEPTARAKNAKKSDASKAALERINAYAILDEETASLDGELGDLDSLEKLMSGLLAESANFTTIESARLFMSSVDPYTLQVTLNNALEDRGWPRSAQTDKVATYAMFDSLLTEIGGGGNNALVGTAADMYEALKKGIAEKRYNLGSSTNAINSALDYFKTIDDVKNFQSGATFKYYRDQMFASENYHRLSDNFITGFSPFREWKGIVCPAIGEKKDCKISDMYAAVARNPEQARDLTDQIRYLFGMPKNGSLRNRYIALLKALRDLTKIAQNINETCKVGERLDHVETTGLTDTYFYTKIERHESWQINLYYKEELEKIIREDSERSNNPKAPQTNFNQQDSRAIEQKSGTN